MLLSMKNSLLSRVEGSKRLLSRQTMQASELQDTNEEQGSTTLQPYHANKESWFGNRVFEKNVACYGTNCRHQTFVQAPARQQRLVNNGTYGSTDSGAACCDPFGRATCNASSAALQLRKYSGSGKPCAPPEGRVL